MGAQGSSRQPILLVEDDPDTREFMAEALRQEGYAVVEAGDGQEAWNLLSAGLRPVLILLDLLMPVMDGWKFRARQQADPVLASIPVVVLTGVHSQPAISPFLNGSDVLTKPINLQQMLRVVARHAPRP